MTDYVELLGRLRAWARDAGYPKQEIITEAAEAIEFLRADNENWQDRALQMQTERDMLTKRVAELEVETIAFWVDRHHQQRERADRGAAEVATLQAAWDDAMKWRAIAVEIEKKQKTL